MLKRRIITALILIPATLAALFYLPQRAFVLLTAFIMLAAAWEWTALMKVQSKYWRWFYLLVMGCLMGASLFIHGLIVLLGAAAWWLVALSLVCLYPHAKSWWSKGPWCRGVMGVLVLLPCWWTINFIRSQPQGIYAVFYIFALIWAADSGAYFIGKRWGKHKLAAEVSPGKSIEGVVGALLCTIIIAGVVCVISGTPRPIWPYAVLLSMATVLFSVVGDLFESMLKREAQLKDSSNLLPGHGGLLDRIDSLTAAVPIFTCGAWLLGNYLN